jgi:hypothetical protein
MVQTTVSLLTAGTISTAKQAFEMLFENVTDSLCHLQILLGSHKRGTL